MQSPQPTTPERERRTDELVQRVREALDLLEPRRVKP